MLRAGPARLRDSLLESLARAEHTNRRIAGRQTLLLREHFHWRSADLNRCERFRVLRLQRRGETRHARTNFGLHIARRCIEGLELTCERLVRSVAAPRLRNWSMAAFRSVR